MKKFLLCLLLVCAATTCAAQTQVTEGVFAGSGMAPDHEGGLVYMHHPAGELRQFSPSRGTTVLLRADALAQKGYRMASPGTSDAPTALMSLWKTPQGTHFLAANPSRTLKGGFLTALGTVNSGKLSLSFLPDEPTTVLNPAGGQRMEKTITLEALTGNKDKLIMVDGILGATGAYSNVLISQVVPEGKNQQLLLFDLRAEGVSDMGAGCSSANDHWVTAQPTGSNSRHFLRIAPSGVKQVVIASVPTYGYMAEVACSSATAITAHKNGDRAIYTRFTDGGAVSGIQLSGSIPVPQTFAVSESGVLYVVTPAGDLWQYKNDILTKLAPTGVVRIYVSKETLYYTQFLTRPTETTAGTEKVFYLNPEPVITVPTVSFTADPATIERGQSTRLNVSVEGATSLTLDPNPGGTVPMHGSLTVAPRETTTYTLTASGTGGSVSKQLTISVVVPEPVPTIESISNAATLNPGTVLASGSFITIQGRNLGTFQDRVSYLTGGASVTVCGLPAPLLYNSGGGQINAIVPREVNGPTTCDVSVKVGSKTSVSRRISIASSDANDQRADEAIAAFPWDFVGPNSTTAIVTDTRGRLIGPTGDPSGSRPGKPGEVAVAWVTGLGPTFPAVLTGEFFTPTDTLYTAIRQPIVKVGGVPVEVLFAGLAPGQVHGLYQVNFRLPEGMNGEQPLWFGNELVGKLYSLTME